MHTKILIRPVSFNSRYQQWQDKHRNQQLEMLRGSYANEVFGQGSEDLQFEHTATHARVTWFPKEIDIEDLSFLLDYFQELMLKNNYYNNLSDERFEVFDNGLKLTIHRHYLKPDISLGEILEPDTFYQYGNVFLEHRFNGTHNTFCVSTNYYSHKRYFSFEKLMEILLA